MRKGFTMIELIFVIVILGVLASVAIPRLAATRDDAEMAKAATNLTTAVGDIAAYYTAQGDFKKKVSTGSTRTTATLSDMTNALDEVSQLTGYIKVKNVKCLKVTATDGTTSGDANIKIEKESNNDNACTNLTKLSGIKNMCGVASGASTATLPCTINVGSSNVNF